MADVESLVLSFQTEEDFEAAGIKWVNPQDKGDCILTIRATLLKGVVPKYVSYEKGTVAADQAVSAGPKDRYAAYKFKQAVFSATFVERLTTVLPFPPSKEMKTSLQESPSKKQRTEGAGYPGV